LLGCALMGNKTGNVMKHELKKAKSLNRNMMKTVTNAR